MPIRINLLAEQQFAEELRRRDPVKRAIWAGAILVGIALCWVVYLQVVLWGVRSRLADYEARYRQVQARFDQAQSSQARLMDARTRIAALRKLSAGRLTWADALNALQHSAMKDVRLTMLRVEQLYSLVEAAKPAVASGTEVPASPQMRARERVTILLEARDSSSRPGDLIASFQEQIQAQPYFKTNVASIEMSGRSSVKTDVGGPSRPYVEFSLQCRFTEREH